MLCAGTGRELLVGVAPGSVGGSGAAGAAQGGLATAATSGAGYGADSAPYPVAFRQNKRPRLEVSCALCLIRSFACLLPVRFP